MLIQPYLDFNGRCEEAFEFYRTALDAELEMLMRNDESPDPASAAMVPPGNGRKVLHASLIVGKLRLMASDGFCTGAPAKFQGVALALSMSDVAEAQRRFEALADGGEVQMPPGPTFFSPFFGMLSDRFGVGWMVMVDPEGEG